MIIDLLRSLFGLIVLILIAYLLSNNKKRIDWSLVVKGVILQIVFAFFVLKIPFVYQIFDSISAFFVTIFRFSEYGTKFLFGNLVTDDKTFGFIFALKVLPSIIFFSAISSLLYYIKVLPLIVNTLAHWLKKLLKISGAESLAAVGNIFLGHTEAPLLVKPYIAKMTQSEILCLVIGGLANISGSVLAACVGILGANDPAKQQFFATHFLSASIISAPAAILISKMIMPETEEIADYSASKIEDVEATNVFDAIANGTFDGLKLAFNVAAMLLVFISLINLLNFVLSDLIGNTTGLNTLVHNGGKGITLEYLFGLAFAPVAWIIGIDANDILKAGQLLGEKTVINEFYAYISLNDMIKSGALLNQRSIVIMTYALCGFANFGSIGIMIGSLGTLAPNQKSTVARLSIKALIGGTIASLMTACVAGLMNF